jgi:hypothetical protein
VIISEAPSPVVSRFEFGALDARSPRLKVLCYASRKAAGLSVETNPRYDVRFWAKVNWDGTAVAWGVNHHGPLADAIMQRNAT